MDRETMARLVRRALEQLNYSDQRIVRVQESIDLLRFEQRSLRAGLEAVRAIVADVRATSPLAGVPAELALKSHPIWQEIAPRGDRPGFRQSEFTSPFAMDAQFLRWLYRVRQETGSVPMRVISDARGDDEGATLSAHKSRPCRAVDLQVYNAAERAVILLAAIRLGCVRWGTYPGKVTAKGKDQAGLHLDCSEELPAPRAWTRF
jgi:hypothetical protein